MTKDESISTEPILIGEAQAIVEDSTDQAKKKKRKSKKKKGAKDKVVPEVFSKNAIAILRTTLRNNIDLTSIADNKANVLLSLNALMMTFSIPFLLPNIALIKQYNLNIPLLLFALSSIVTIYFAFLVLRPGKFKGQDLNLQKRAQLSPFFFGNFASMSKEAYLEHFESVLKDEKKIKKFLTNDFYYLGLRLGEKMKYVRLAFNIFIGGLILSVVLSIILIILYS